jgi:long-chain acyl-CoA synthetase
VSVHWPIIWRCLSNPTRVAVIDERRSYRAIELLVAATHVANAIASRCASPTVGVLIPASGAFPIAALAAWMLGKTVVPLNFLLKRDELQYVVDDCGCDTILAVTPLLDHMGYAPTGARIVALDTLDFKGVPEPVFPASPDDDDLAVLLYTSGTSGRPKGVMLTHANLQANASQVRDWAHVTTSDILLGVLPQFHSFGLTVMTIMPLTFGMRVVYAPRFLPPRIIRLIRDHQPTMFVGIPSMYNALLAAKDASAADFASLRYVVSGGEPLPESVFSRFRERFGLTINEGYGLTETSPVTNWCRPHEFRLHSVGRALPGIEQRIVDPATNEPLPPHRDGEVQMRGPNVMRGYFRLPEETAAVFTPDGFFKTGDMGRLDDEGHLYITGRIKEMMIVGGENVFPREIEEVLNKHPLVKASGVISRMDPMRGEVPVAFVELNDVSPELPATLPERLDPKALELTLKAFARDRLAGYKVPDSIRVLDALPRNPTGKIMRRELKPLL